MEHRRASIGGGGGDDGAGIPEEHRCKRSDGKQWRCNSLSMPDKTVCEKHYIQAKKRAANSALRAKKAKRKALGSGGGGVEAEDDMEGCVVDEPEEFSRSLSPYNGGAGDGQFSGSGSGSTPSKKHKERIPRVQRVPTPERVAGRESSKEGRFDHFRGEESRNTYLYDAAPCKEVKQFTDGGPGEFSGRSFDSSGDGTTCHQCQKGGRTNVVWCSGCDRRGYCDGCLAKWYPEITMEEMRRACPACRNVCTCRSCLRGDSMIKARILQVGAMDKLRYLHRLLSFVLPVIKEIYAEHCFELVVETRVSGGMKADIPRANIQSDEQMYCDFCRIPIIDYHRHCTNCFYDLCLSCCRDLRRASTGLGKREHFEHKTMERSNDGECSPSVDLHLSENGDDEDFLLQSSDRIVTDIFHSFPNWKAHNDGSIPCAPSEAGGCGSSKLALRRILKINWVAKLVKNAEEMVNGCKVDVLDPFGRCTCNAVSELQEETESKLSPCSNNCDKVDAALHTHVPQVLKNEGIDHFHKHWVKGEPVVVKKVLDGTLASKWDPISIWRVIQEIQDERAMEDSEVVKAIDCLTHTEVEIEFEQFFNGFVAGSKHENGWPRLLRLKDWPPPKTLEEFISCQSSEFLDCLPLLEFIHAKYGILNLIAKLPTYAVQNEVGPKVCIDYGFREELGQGDSVDNLRISMSDLVYLMMHTSEGYASSTRSNWSLQPTKDHNHKVLFSREEKLQEDRPSSGTEAIISTSRELDLSRAYQDVRSISGKVHAGAIWDVFHRNDIKKINKYLTLHQKEFASSAIQQFVSEIPVYDQAFYLNNDHKIKLREEFGVVPWTIGQQFGEAVYVPAGCPFQVRILQSSVQLALGFLSPESLGETVKIAQEIRCLPNDHDAKLKMLEVGKIALYAASSAVSEIESIVLDPELGLGAAFDCQNLTAAVSENLERMMQLRQVACS